MQHTPPRGRGRYQRRSNTRQQRPLAPGQHCVICYEEQPDEPMGCLSCRQLIGCRKCVMKWRRTNNISELNRRSPLSIGCSSVNHRKCPLCRAEWDLDPEIAPWDELRTD
uniref:RING-type domain-containing protein n=1 Tax=Ascaris lumbricoides TaxID=6252 RepID=A0A0M3ICJ7_ASCLU